MQHIETYSDGQISTIVRSCAQLGCTVPPLLQRTAAEVVRRLPHFDDQSLPPLLWSYAKLNFSSKQLFIRAAATLENKGLSPAAGASDSGGSGGNSGSNSLADDSRTALQQDSIEPCSSLPAAAVQSSAAESSTSGAVTSASSNETFMAPDNPCQENSVAGLGNTLAAETRYPTEVRHDLSGASTSVTEQGSSGKGTAAPISGKNLGVLAFAYSRSKSIGIDPSLSGKMLRLVADQALQRLEEFTKAELDAIVRALAVGNVQHGLILRAAERETRPKGPL